MKAVIYKTVHSLVELAGKEQFCEKTHQFLQSAKDSVHTEDFAQYFKNEYAARPELWAYCYQ